MIKVGKLPDDWEEFTDEQTGLAYYVNTVQQITQWERPSDGLSVRVMKGTDLADGWEAKFDPELCKVYGCTVTLLGSQSLASEDMLSVLNKGVHGHIAPHAGTSSSNVARRLKLLHNLPCTLTAFSLLI